jgi:Protein of unknown function (DUF2934)
MSIAIANLQKQKQKEEVRARLLADETIRGRIAFRAFEIYQRHGDGHGGALTNWLQAEDEIVSSLVEQELQLSSESTSRKGRRDSPKASAKPRKKSPSRAASVSDTAAKRKTNTKQPAPTSAKTIKDEISTSDAKKLSSAGVKRKERSKAESQSV